MASLVIVEGSGPFRYGDTVTFASDAKSDSFVVAVFLYQEADGDLALLGLGQSASLPLGEATDTSKPAKGRAVLYRFDGGHAEELARTGFYVEA